MTRPDLPGPMRRRGPRPLLLHLWLAILRATLPTGTPSRASPNGSPSSKPESPNWNAAAQARMADLAAALAQGRADAFPAALVAEILRRDDGLIAGIAAYRRHPWRRDLADPPAIWSEGETRLLDYGATAPEAAAAPALLVVPSLVNRAHVLDLTSEQSLLRFLAARGLRPLLLDWGWPGAVERGFTLTDYTAGRLERALHAATTASGGKVVLAGYCMGGLLALAAATRRPDLLRGLVLLATPWDFHAPDPLPARHLAGLLPALEPLMALSAALPVDALQVLFGLLDPWGVAGKYRAFARLDPNGARAALFVALEDWLNDGVPLAAPVARECLRDWYGANAPARAAWRVAGAPVDPSGLRLPAFVAVPGRDRIVPPESARPLALRIQGAVLHEPAAGHVGMVAGSQARAALWQPLADWLAALPA